MIEGLNEAYDVASVPTGDITFSITSNVPWSISQKDLDWVTITPSRGLGEKELVVVTITPAVNKALEPREGTFTLTAGTVKRNVKTSIMNAFVASVRFIVRPRFMEIWRKAFLLMAS